MSTEALPRLDLVAQAEDLVPLLRSHAQWQEENRRLHDEVVEAMAGAGIFRMRVPKRYGGLETDARTVVEVLTRLGEGDGSTAWNASVWSISNWLACLFPDEVQDEVFATPDTRVCGVLSPTALAEPVDGGFVINGRWGFISGALHSQWQVVIAMGPAPDGSQWPVMAVVPMSDLTIDDDWHTSGLNATGSVSTVAQNVFVPAQRVLPMIAVLQEQYASQANADSQVYTGPMMATGCVSFVGTAVGLAKGATGRLPRAPAGPQDHLHRLRQAERGAADASAGGGGTADQSTRRSSTPRGWRRGWTRRAPPASRGRCPSGWPRGQPSAGSSTWRRRPSTC